MRLLKVAVSMLALASGVYAQLPATTVHVGTKLRTQSGGINNQQRVSVVAAPGHTLSDIGLGLRARLGSTVFAYAAGFDDIPVATFLPPQNISHWFSLTWMDTIVHTVPIAEPGHNWIFGVPDLLYTPSFNFEILGPSPWDYEQLGASSPLGWQAYFLQIPIPSNAMLSGSAVSLQSYRLDDEFRFFASDEAVFVIG